MLLSAGVLGLFFARRRRDSNHTKVRIAVALVWLVSLLGLVLVPAKAVVVYEYGLVGTPIPWGMTVDQKSGNVWITEQSANKIASVYPGTPTEYTIPTAGSVPWGIAASIDHEDIWFTEENAGQIGRLVRSENKFYEFYLWRNSTETPRPRGIAMNITKMSDGYRPRYDVWFTEFGRNRIGHLYSMTDPNQVRFSFYNITAVPGVKNAQPLCIAMSPLDYSVWFTEYATNRISSLRLLENGTAVFRHYPTGSSSSGLWGIGVDLAGFVWVAESSHARNCIGRLNPVTGEYVTFVIPTPNSEPHELVLETCSLFPDRPLNIWFAEYNSDKIGRYDPGLNVFFEYPILSTGGRPHGIAVYPSYSSVWPPSSNVWFTEPFTQRIGVMYNWYNPPLITTTTVGTISSAVTTSTTLAISRVGTTSGMQSTTALTSLVGSTTIPATTVSKTYTFTSSQLVLTTTSVYSYTATSRSTSYTTATTTTTTMQTTASVSTIPTTTTTTATYISWNVQTSSVTTSRTNTIFLTSTSLTTTTLTRTSTSIYPTVTITSANTSFISTTTFSPTATLTSAQTSVISTTSLATTVVTTTTTTTTTVAITRPCIIASVAYGSELAPEVQFLRGVRDGPVVSTFAGAQFIRVFNAFYYSFSPSVARLVGRISFLSTATKALITPLLTCLHTATSPFTMLQVDQETGILVMGILASALIGTIYLLPLLFVTEAFWRRLKTRRGV